MRFLIIVCQYSSLYHITEHDVQKVENMNNKKAIRYAILAALLYAFSTPFSKILMEKIPPTFLAGFLYLGAGFGMFFIPQTTRHDKKAERLTHSDIPYMIAMIILDIIAPILLMISINNSSAETVSLLNNFEIAATSVIALVIFKERISGRLWTGIILITLASILLSLTDIYSLSFSIYSLLAILACICWGFENNCTKKLSHSEPIKVVIVKGLGSGTGALIVAFLSGDKLSYTPYILLAFLLGFVAYGLSIFFYIRAQRYIGAAKTSAFYALAPFISALISLILFQKIPGLLFISAFILMATGAYFTIEKKRKTA